MKKLYVVDASGYLYRSYFAIRNVTNAKGESTNALFGFIRSILKLQKDFHPEHLVAVFDGPHGPKKRIAIYEQYKAHRVAMPEDLRYQIEWAKQACGLLGISCLSVPEVEADDTMASVAIWAAEKDSHVYLCTSDKDLCQLVNERISILNTFKENLILDPKGVEEAFGVKPEQMVDYLSIVGDSSDNVPGLPGFGPKTAVALLQEHGTLDHILKHPELVAGKKRETIEQFADQALLSRQLVTLHMDVPFEKEKVFFSIKPIDIAALKAFYASMNFNSLIRELEQTAPAEVQKKFEEDTQQPSYITINDEKAFTELLKLLSKQKEIAVSMRTTHSQPIKAEMIGISFSFEPYTSWYIPLNGALEKNRILEGLKQLFENPSIGFYGHNFKHDYQVLKNYGITVAKIVFDTMLASYLLNSQQRQHSLEHLMMDHFGKVRPAEADLLGKGKKAILMSEVPLEAITENCCLDTDYIVRIKAVLFEQLNTRNLMHLMDGLELPLMRVLAEMERHGIYVDIPYLSRMSSDINRMISGLEQEIYALAGEEFNLNSPKQLSEILFTKLGIKPPKKTATGHSTNADVLEFLKAEYPIAEKLLEYRTLEKLRSTYVDILPTEVFEKTHRIHCTFNQSVAATGRLSCQDPNLQNIPIRSEIGKKIRGAFRPAKENWSFIAADYSQIELRLLAHFSEDINLTKAFKQGQDVHTTTAAAIFNIPLEEVTSVHRHRAKAVNFGIVYGQQAFGLSQATGVDIKEAAAFITAYFNRYPKVKAYLDECKQEARDTGKSVTFTGRERMIPEIHSKNMQIKAAAERLAINTPLQGTAADLIKMAMLQIDEKLKEKKSKAFMILQIHDELIFEVPDDEVAQISTLVRDVMQNVFQLKVPLLVDITVGKNWAEC